MKKDIFATSRQATQNLLDLIAKDEIQKQNISQDQIRELFENKDLDKEQMASLIAKHINTNSVNRFTNSVEILFNTLSILKDIKELKEIDAIKANLGVVIDYLALYCKHVVK